MTTTTSNPPTLGGPGIEILAPTAAARRTRWRIGRRVWMGLLIVAMVAAGSMGFYRFRPRSGKAAIDVFTVTPRDFPIALHEKGELKAAKSIDVKCEVEGRSTIIWLVPEGTEVTEGELLVKLASEEIDDRVRSEEIKEANAKAAAEAAAKEYDIVADEQASQIRRAELALQNARIEYYKYIEGDWVQQKTDAELDIKRAEEVHRRKAAELADSRELFEQYLFSVTPARVEELAAGDLSPALRAAFAERGTVLSQQVTVTADLEGGSKWLIADPDRRFHARLEEGEWRVYFERNFITKLQLEQDEFALLEAEIELEKAKLRREILEKYTHPKDLQQKTSDVEEAEKELERTRKSAEAKTAQALANKEAKAAEYAFTQQQLEKFRRQQAKTEIRAPAAGLVVYDTGRSRWDRRQIAEGAEVYERQTIIKLPDTEVMQVLVRIHEGKANKVQMGQNVRVEVEGMPGVVLHGKVTKTAPLADSQDSWLNPELKEYQTEITLNSNGYDLKPGVTARAEIQIDEVRNVLAVPVQACVTKQGRRFVFRGRGQTAEPVQVELGRSNEEYVEVLNGLTQGDVVRLAMTEEDMQRIPDLGPEEPTAANGKPVGGEGTPERPTGAAPQTRRGGQPGTPGGAGTPTPPGGGGGRRAPGGGGGQGRPSGGRQGRPGG